MRETLIQGFLFLCGALSILTTVGIVYELGKELLAFFTRQLWENSNKPLAQDLNPEDTVMQVGPEGTALRPEDLIQVHDEVMRVVSVEGVALLRSNVGCRALSPRPTRRGSRSCAVTRVTLREFFTPTKWQPQIGQFGILPLVNATLMTTLIAMLVALPLGLGVAIYLSEYASRARCAFSSQSWKCWRACRPWSTATSP